MSATKVLWGDIPDEPVEFDPEPEVDDGFATVTRKKALPKAEKTPLFMFREAYGYEGWHFLAKVLSLDEAMRLAKTKKLVWYHVYDPSINVVFDYKHKTKSFERVDPSEAFLENVKKTIAIVMKGSK